MSRLFQHADLPAELNDLTHDVIAAALRVHKDLGPGLLERPYHVCLLKRLRLNGLRVESEVPIPLVYEGEQLDVAFRADVVVEDALIIEVKAVREIADVHLAQMHTYLKLTGCRVGLILNFNERYLRDGIKRVVLTGR